MMISKAKLLIALQADACQTTYVKIGPLKFWAITNDTCHRWQHILNHSAKTQ